MPTTDTKAEQAQLLRDMARIVNKAGGISNIGMLDDYWVMLKRYNFLLSEEKYPGSSL